QSTPCQVPPNAAVPCNFAIPSAGNIGLVGRNAFYGPSYTDFDFSLQKNFPVTEHKRFQFRADFFNVLNHPNFALPNGSLGMVQDSTTKIVTVQKSAGTISNMNGNPRLIQLGLRFDF